MPKITCPTCGTVTRVQVGDTATMCPECFDWLPVEKIPDVLPVASPKKRPNPAIAQEALPIPKRLSAKAQSSQAKRPAQINRNAPTWLSNPFVILAAGGAFLLFGVLVLVVLGRAFVFHPHVEDSAATPSPTGMPSVAESGSRLVDPSKPPVFDVRSPFVFQDFDLVMVPSVGLVNIATSDGIRESKEQYLRLAIRVHNHSATRKLDYHHLAGGVWLGQPRLTDDLGNQYRVANFGFYTIVGEADDKSLYPGGTVDDLVVFERPVAGIKELRFELQTNRFDYDHLPYDHLTIVIPANAIRY
jgi:hypothetical protein